MTFELEFGNHICSTRQRLCRSGPNGSASDREVVTHKESSNLTQAFRSACCSRCLNVEALANRQMPFFSFLSSPISQRLSSNASAVRAQYIMDKATVRWNCRNRGPTKEEMGVKTRKQQTEIHSKYFLKQYALRMSKTEYVTKY